MNFTFGLPRIVRPSSISEPFNWSTVFFITNKIQHARIEKALGLAHMMCLTQSYFTCNWILLPHGQIIVAPFSRLLWRQKKPKYLYVWQTERTWSSWRGSEASPLCNGNLTNLTRPNGDNSKAGSKALRLQFNLVSGRGQCLWNVRHWK